MRYQYSPNYTGHLRLVNVFFNVRAIIPYNISMKVGYITKILEERIWIREVPLCIKEVNSLDWSRVYTLLSWYYESKGAKFYFMHHNFAEIMSFVLNGGKLSSSYLMYCNIPRMH